MATEVQRFKYRVVGANTLIASEGKDYRVGDEVELPKHVAINFRQQLEPLDDAGKLEDVDTDQGKFMARMATLRDHEKQQELESEKEKLENRLDAIDAELERIKNSARPTAQTPASTAKASAEKAAVKK